MPPAIPDKIPCESTQQLEQELATLREALSYPETEETWDRIARALTRFGAVVKGGGYKFEKELIHGVKTSVKPIVSAMNSERTRLSAAALDCITIIAPRIGLTFESLAPLFVPHILHLATRPNKVYVTRSQATMGLILGYCPIPSIIPLLVTACKESKIVTGRAIALEGVLRCLNKWDWAQRDIRAKVGDVENIIKITGRDKDAGIRQTSRKVFEAYKTLFPERVEEFTGPLTPVMRKYLDIKPLKQGEQAHQSSAAEKSRRPLSRPDFASSTSAVPSSTSNEPRNGLGTHVRSTSSNAITGPSNLNSRPPHDADKRSMPPPAIIPAHGRNVSRSRVRSPTGGQQDGNTQHERERVISTTSTYSTKSAPAESHSSHEHRPPMRLVNSQTQSSRAFPAVTGSSGQARRVLKVVQVEPHPANRPQTMPMAHKAPVRPTPNVTALKVGRTTKGPSREGQGVTHSAPTSSTGVAFPTSESVERKGAQRVPKPAPTAASAPTTPPKAERPVTVIGVASKREVKPSIFRRGVPNAPGAGPKDGEKKQEGFAPRRGGGVMQPTLSQLSKQKASVSVSTTTSLTSKPRPPSNRPAWGTSGASRTVSTRGLPAARGRSRGISRPQTPKPDKPKPAMIPLPASPGCEKDAVPQMVPLPASPKPEPLGNEQTDAVPPTNEVLLMNAVSREDKVPQADETPNSTEEPTKEASDVAEEHEPEDETADEVVRPEVPVEIPEAVDSTGNPEQREDLKSDQHSDIAQEIDTLERSDNLDSVGVQTSSAPRTPPFPPTDSESEDDELDDIEFTTRSAYAPGGVPIKTPRKLAVLSTDGAPRNPLGEVVLNA